MSTIVTRPRYRYTVLATSSHGNPFRVRGIHRSQLYSPHTGPETRALMFSLILALTKGWTNSRLAGDLRYHVAYCDVPVMKMNNYYKMLYSALPISRGHCSPHNSRKTLIARPLGRGMGVFREFEMWPKFYLRKCCAVCNIVFYCTAIYRESIVLGYWILKQLWTCFFVVQTRRK